MTIVRSSSVGFTPDSAFNTSQRRARHLREHARLEAALRLQASSLKGVDVIGTNEVVADLASHYGLSPEDFVAMLLRRGGESVTAIGVPTRIWHNARAHAQLCLLKSDMRRAGHRCILAPEQILRRQPRLRNLEMIEAASEKAASPTCDIAILQLVGESGGASIIDCANLIAGPGPVEAVLSLVANGQLHLDVSRAIGPMTLVTLASSEVPR
jgi:hypothetical protein